MILKVLSLVLPVLLLTAPVSDDDLETYREKGDQITDATQAVLLKELTAAMKAGGPPNAVAYCNSRAQMIMDSVSEAEGVWVRRKSDRTRNLRDALLNDRDIEAFNRLRTALQEGGTPVTMVDDEGMTVEYYRPIVIKKPCLACHGTPGETVADETLEVINQAYPNDQATGYKVGDLRGMWHLSFKLVERQLEPLER